MRRRGLRVLTGVLLLFAASNGAGAQDQGNGKNPPKQTPDHGVDDAGSQPPAQQRKLGERNIEAAKVTLLPGGVLMAHLDESFEDALVVARDADGTMRFTCLHGLPAAGKHIASPKQPVSAAPGLEER